MNQLELWMTRMMGWDEAAPRLRIRVYPDAWLADNDEPPFERDVYPGLHGIVVLDLPDRALPVTHDHLEAWGDFWTAEYLLQRAIEQSLTLETKAETRRDGRVDTVLVTGDSHIYTSAQAFHPERHLPTLGPTGAIVALPSRDIVVLHELGRGEVKPALALIGSMTKALHDGSASPLSEDLFWYQGPKLRARRIGTSEGVGMVKAIVDESVVRAMVSANDRARNTS